MHISGKILMTLGGVICILGIVLMIIGGSATGKAFDIENDNVFEGTSGEFYTNGEDDLVIYIKDDIDCNTVSLTIIDDNGEDQFVPDDDCTVPEDDPAGFWSIGTVDWLIDAPGNYTVNSSHKIYVFELWGAVGDAVGGALAGAGGFGMLCCGGFFLILGLILGLSIKDNSPTVMHQGSLGQPIVAMGQPAVVQPSEPSGVVGEVAGQAVKHVASEAVTDWFKDSQ